MIRTLMALGLTGSVVAGCGQSSESQSSAKNLTQGSFGDSPDSCMGLASCSPPASALLTFSEPTEYGMTACTVSSARLIPTAAGFVGILKANCNAVADLYSIGLSQGGEALTNPVRVSTSCQESNNPVDRFAVDASPVSILLAYSCSATVGASSKNLHSVVLSLTGQVLQSRSDIRRSVVGGFLVGWHQSSMQFAVAGPTWFQRFSAHGESVGGAVVLSSASTQMEEISDLRVSDSGWQVIKGPVSSWSGSSLSLNCSKIIPTGQMTCTNQRLNAAATSESTDFLIAKNSLGGFTRSIFMPDTCTDSSTRDIGNSAEVDATTIYSARSLSGNLYAVLYRSFRQTLAVGVFQRDSSEVVVINPVSNVGSVGSAQMGEGSDGRLFVMWVDGNVMKMVRAGG